MILEPEPIRTGGNHRQLSPAMLAPLTGELPNALPGKGEFYGQVAMI